MAESPKHPRNGRHQAAAHGHTDALNSRQAAARRDVGELAPMRMLALLSLAIVVASIHPALELVAYLGETGPV